MISALSPEMKIFFSKFYDTVKPIKTGHWINQILVDSGQMFKSRFLPFRSFVNSTFANWTWGIPNNELTQFQYTFLNSNSPVETVLIDMVRCVF
jgi:hypothetical protein